MLSLRKKALTGVIWSLLDKVVNQFGSLALIIYLSNILIPSDFGLIAMLAIFIAIAQSIIDSGFSQALIQKSQNVTEADLSTVFYINCIVSILLYTVFYASIPLISDFYSEPKIVDLAKVQFLVVIINSFAIVPRAKLAIDINFKPMGISTTIATVLSSILTIISVNNGLGYWSLVVMTITSSLVQTVFLFIFSGWKPKLMFSLESCQRLFNFGYKLLLAGILSTIAQNLSSLMIGRYYNSTTLGYYQQSYNYTNKISYLISSVVQGVTYPILTSVKEDDKRFEDIYIKVMSIITIIVFPILIGFSAISQEFVEVFLGEQWLPIIPIVFYLSLARCFTPISSLNMNILNAKGRSDLYLMSDLIKIPISILLLYISIPYGVEVVAFSTLVFTIISFFINAYFTGTLIDYGVRRQILQLLPIILISSLMYCSTLFINLNNNVTQMLLKVFVGAMTYVLCCHFFKIKGYQNAKEILIKRL
ncbi:lipopolysaccharide biosynthesis protein [Vibrio breoganii]|uniref:lipopolysaccharide biosynthesis protein n=1 Tax=Vibrio breoganii TaxID=553239 RepID=UPI000C83300D|nr:lipopolysaccharide biosynthesis protein [Vibrio breoganii]PMM80193.1 lipopolysaccharide biosynthesis protein [Vibrio breoganii]